MTNLLKEFFKSEQAAGVVLVFCTAFSLVAANAPNAHWYHSGWEYMLFGHSVSYWINDALMAVFFLLVGLEIEREIYVGELSEPRKALLPIVAALGGMIVPAAIHFAINGGSATQAGFGIPMATDIAFALGVLALLGSRVPLSLKVFLMALAIIDDLGAIVVIALFYSTSLSFVNLLIAAGIVGVLFVCNRRKINSLAVYLVGGVFLWYFVHESGVHATISGVILAFLIPFRDGEHDSPSFRLQHILHYPVAFIILPLFALANTRLVITDGWHAGLLQSNSIGIALGLLAGKPVGITAASLIGAKARWLTLPADLKWRDIAAVSLLGGVGFTMSIFITLLAFQDPVTVQESKIAILCASLLAGILGFIAVRFVLPSVEDSEP
jgi:Na+:H+ antiporter, NhaA family